MKLSIIIPVYNVEKYIEKCLISIWKQLSNDLEVIIVNDGTPDNSMNIVCKYNFKNLTIIQQKNKGLSAARNAGLRIAKGDYVWFIDSDDWIYEDAISRFFVILDSNIDNNIDIYSTNLTTVTEKDGNTYNQDYLSKYVGCTMSGKEYLCNKIIYGTAQRFFFNRNFLQRNNLFFAEGRLHEDGDFGFRAIFFAKKIKILSDYFYFYLLRGKGSIMSTWKKKNSDDVMFLVKERVCFLRDKEIDSYASRSYNEIIMMQSMFSILIAKDYFKTKEFHQFYNENKNIMKKLAQKVLYSKPTTFKLFIIATIVCISPQLYIRMK